MTSSWFLACVAYSTTKMTICVDCRSSWPVDSQQKGSVMQKICAYNDIIETLRMHIWYMTFIHTCGQLSCRPSLIKDCITDPLCWESIGHRWIPSQRANTAERLSMSWRHMYRVYHRCLCQHKAGIVLVALCVGNPPVTGGFPAQRASTAASVSLSWHHVYPAYLRLAYLRTNTKQG